MLLNKNINFNKIEVVTKMENPTHSFRETNLVFFSMYSVLNTLSEHAFLYISKSINSYTFLLVFKIVEILQCILNCNIKFNNASSYIYFIVYFSQKMVKISSTYFQIHFSRDFLLSPMQTLVNIFFWRFQTQSQSYSHHIIISVLVVQYTHYLIVSKTLHSSVFICDYCCERI